MTITNRLVAIVLAAITFCVGLYWARGVVNVPVDFKIFSRSGAPLTAGQFYAPAEHNKLAFSDGASGDGAVTITRDGAPLQPTIQDYDKRYYTLRTGDSVCAGSSCSAQTADGDMVAVDGETPWWSTRSLSIDASSLMSITAGMYFRSQSTDKLVLASPKVERLEARTISPGLNVVQSNDFSVANWPRAAYAFIFASALAGAIWTMIVNWSSIVAAIARVRWFATALLIQIAIQYSATLPGMFNTDLIVHRANSNEYTSWYSSIYMIYSTTFYPLYPSLIQIPNVIIYYVSCVYIANLIIGLKNGERILRIFFILQLLSPAILTMLYSQQRIFVGGVIIFAAISKNYIDINRYRRFTITGLTLLVIAALLRTEYFAFFAAFVIIVWWIRGSSYFRTAAAIRAVAAICAAYLLINVATPTLYGEQANINNAGYSLASSLDMAHPYVECKTMSGPFVKSLDTLGGIQNYCASTPENFFWEYARRTTTENILRESAALRSELLSSMFENPMPAFARLRSRLINLLTEPHWQIFNRYQYQNATDSGMQISAKPTTIAAFDIPPPYPWPIVADRTGLTPDYSWQPPLANAIIGFYSALGKLPLNAIWLAFAIVGVPLLFRDWKIQVLNLTVLAIVVLAAFASPTVNWSYILILPIWGLLVVPLAHLSRHMVQDTAQSPEKGLSQAPA